MPVTNMNASAAQIYGAISLTSCAADICRTLKPSKTQIDYKDRAEQHSTAIPIMLGLAVQADPRAGSTPPFTAIQKQLLVHTIPD
jgi:hypothetical protein